MARRPSISVRAQVLTALQEFTQKELAAQLGVSERTIRRWKNEGVQPANPFVALALHDEYRAEKKRIQSRNRRFAPGAIPPKSEIPLIGERRQLREYDAKNQFTGKYYPSDYVNYNVVRLDYEAVFGILKDLRDRSATIQLIYRVNRYPGELQFLSPGERNATGLFNLAGFTDADLWNGHASFKGLASYVSQGNNTRLMFIAVLDRGVQARAKRKRSRKK